MTTAGKFDLRNPAGAGRTQQGDLWLGVERIITAIIGWVAWSRRSQSDVSSGVFRRSLDVFRGSLDVFRGSLEGFRGSLEDTRDQTGIIPKFPREPSGVPPAGSGARRWPHNLDISHRGACRNQTKDHVSRHGRKGRRACLPKALPVRGRTQTGAADRHADRLAQVGKRRRLDLCVPCDRGVRQLNSDFQEMHARQHHVYE